MQYQEFKEKVKELNDIYFDVVKIANSNVNNTIKQIKQNFKNNQSIQNLELKTLEENLNKLREEKDMDISSEKSKILNLRLELENSLKIYQKKHDYELEKRKLFRKKDETLREKLQPLRKEISDIKLSIENLNNECLQIEKENEQKNIEKIAENELKAIEIEKKTRYEVNKINEALLTPIVNNDTKVDTTKVDTTKVDATKVDTKSQISSIRNKGIKEIANIKKKSFEDIKELKIENTKFTANSKMNNELLRAEYSLKIINKKQEIKQLNNKIKQLKDDYDFNAYKTLNELKKRFGFEENDIYSLYQSKIFAIDNEINKKEFVKNECIKDNANKIVETIYQYDIVQFNEFVDYLNESFINFENKLDSSYEHLTNYLVSIIDNVIGQIDKFFDNFKMMQKSFLNNLVGMKYHSYVINGFTYENFNKEMNKSLDNYCTLFEKRLKIFQKSFKLNVDNILKAIDDNHRLILEYKNQEKEEIDNYKNELQDNLDINLQIAKNYNTKFYEDLNYQSKKKYDEVLLNQAIEKENIKVKNNNSVSIYNQDEIDLNKKQKEYNKKVDELIKKENQEYNDSIKTINNNIKIIKDTYKKSIENEIIKLEKEHQANLKMLEEEISLKFKMAK